MRALAIGDRHQPQPRARRRQHGYQAAGAEHLVVRVRGHDDGAPHPGQPGSGPAPGSVLSHGQAAQVRSSVPGASIGCRPEARVTTCLRPRRRALRAAPGRAPRDAGAGRPSDRRPRGNAPHRGRAAPRPARAPFWSARRRRPPRSARAPAGPAAVPRRARHRGRRRSRPPPGRARPAPCAARDRRRPGEPARAGRRRAWTRRRAASARRRGRPPYQQAATPTPPWLNPGRFVYPPGGPTGTAGTRGKPTSSVSLPAIPVAGQLSTSGSSSSVSTANSRGPSSAAAVTRASRADPGPRAVLLGALEQPAIRTAGSPSR